MDIQGKIPAVLLTRHRTVRQSVRCQYLQTVRHEVWLKINKTPFTCQLFGRNAAVTAEAERMTHLHPVSSLQMEAEEMLSFQVIYIYIYIYIYTHTYTYTHRYIYTYIYYI